jgi:YegS/Rv2252/BmrU family lipid kinase
MEKQQILFIINPISGVYKKEHIPEKIAKYIDYTKYDFTIRTTQYAGHATEIAREAIKEGFKTIVAVGGDGSINEVANALIGTDVVLGIIPYGSGNGLALHLGMTPRNAKKSLELLNTGKVVKMDVIKTNIRYFLSCGGFGYDAHAARRFRSQEIRGLFSYILAGAREAFWHFKPSKAKVQIDDEVIERDVYLFTAFNSNQYGYNIGFLPTASAKDGIMDVILLNAFPLRRLLLVFGLMILKRTDLVKEAETFRAKKIKIFGNKKMVYQFDGDHFVFHDDLEMEIVPQALNVIIPSDTVSY